jgi:TetR/AcrR family transcriptional repressor of lmrAB and yxaGH operons
MPVREACDEVFASWERLIAGRLIADGIAPAAAAGTATVVLAALEGGLILARTRQDTAPLLAVADSVERLLG